MLIEQIIEFDLRRPGTLPVHVLVQLRRYFHDKTKIFELIFIYCKILQEAMYLTFRYLGRITYKI